jgi:hypothetical protein
VLMDCYGGAVWWCSRGVILSEKFGPSVPGNGEAIQLLSSDDAVERDRPSMRDR